MSRKTEISKRAEIAGIAVGVTTVLSTFATLGLAVSLYLSPSMPQSAALNDNSPVTPSTPPENTGELTPIIDAPTMMDGATNQSRRGGTSSTRPSLSEPRGSEQNTNKKIYANFSKDGKIIITSDSESVGIWDAQSGREIAKVGGTLLSLPTSKVLLTVNKWADRSIIRRWDTESGKELQALEMPDGWTHQANYSPDRKKIVMHNGRHAFIWDVESGRKLFEFGGKYGHDYSFFADGSKIATEGYDSTRNTSITQILDAESGRELQRIDGRGARFSSDGKKIATGESIRNQSFYTRIWDVNSGRELRKLEGMPSRFFPDSKKIVTYYARGSDRGGTTYRIFDVDSGRELMKFEENAVGSLAKFSPDDKKFITEFRETVSSEDGRGRMSTGYTMLRIWDAESCRELQKIRAKSYYSSFYFSADGNKFVTYDPFQRIIQIWDVKTGKELYSLEGQTTFPRQERITKVGATSGGVGSIGENQPIRNGKVRIWDIDSGKEMHQFDGEFLGFSPDEEKIVTASGNGTIQIWDAMSGKELHRLNHSYSVPVTDVSLPAMEMGMGQITDASFDIFSAAEKGTVQDVCSCVSQGADIREKTSLGETPLHRAATYNPNVEVVKYLISQGADVNAKDSGGITPLHQATLGNSNVEVVKHLVSQGADVNARTQLGGTPLHQAAGYNSNVEILKYLISCGADVNAKYNDGKTPLDLADTEEKRHILREAGRSSPPSPTLRRNMPSTSSNAPSNGTSSSSLLGSRSGRGPTPQPMTQGETLPTRAPRPTPQPSSSRPGATRTPPRLATPSSR